MDYLTLYCHYQAVHKLSLKSTIRSIENIFCEKVRRNKFIELLKQLGYKRVFEYEDVGYREYKKHTFYVNNMYANETLKDVDLKTTIDDEHFHLILWLSLNRRPLMSYTDVQLFWPEYSKPELVRVINKYFETIPARAKNLHKTQRDIALINNGDMPDLERCSNRRDFGALYDLIVLPNYNITPRFYPDNTNMDNKLVLTELTY